MLLYAPFSEELMLLQKVSGPSLEAWLLHLEVPQGVPGTKGEHGRTRVPKRPTGFPELGFATVTLGFPDASFGSKGLVLVKNVSDSGNPGCRN